ncbi:hypothetical protein P4S73_11390 [Paraglaciecola sp. Hal342]
MTNCKMLTSSNMPKIKTKTTSMANAMKMLLITLTAPFILSACGDEDNSQSQSGSEQSATADASQVDIKLFSLNALAKQPEIVDCTLENGDDAQCAKLVVKYLPDEMEIGPFCPQRSTTKVAYGIGMAQKPAYIA